MPKQWKQSRPHLETLSSEPKPDENKIFGAELSGNAPSIDLHALDTQSGIHELEVFLHSAFMRGEDVVKIIHGRGTGKMREAVHAFLSIQPFVETFRDGQNPAEVLGVTYAVLSKPSL